jgi:hypothetical protein
MEVANTIAHYVLAKSTAFTVFDGTGLWTHLGLRMDILRLNDHSLCQPRKFCIFLIISYNVNLIPKTEGL